MSHEINFQYGTYTGNASTQSIAVSFQPGLLFIFNLADGSLNLKNREYASSEYITYPGGPAVNTGVTFTADGFDLDGDAAINSSGDTIYWCAWDDLFPGLFTPTWVGDGNSGNDGPFISLSNESICILTGRDTSEEDIAINQSGITSAVGQAGNTNWAWLSSQVDRAGSGTRVRGSGLNVLDVAYEAALLTPLEQASGTSGGSASDGLHNNSPGWWGSYTGNGGTFTREFDEAPAVMFIHKGTANNPSAFRTADMPTGDWGKCRLKAFTHETSGFDMDATGFTVTGADLNKNNQDYTFWVWFDR